MNHSIGFYSIPNSNDNSGFGAVLNQREDEARLRYIAQELAKCPAPAKAPAPATRSTSAPKASGKRTMTHSEARERLARRGVPEHRLRSLFPAHYGIETRVVERHVTCGAFEMRRG